MTIFEFIKQAVKTQRARTGRNCKLNRAYTQLALAGSTKQPHGHIKFPSGTKVDRK